MPRKKSVTHEKIVAAAKKELERCGFKEASMRNIAAEAGQRAVRGGETWLFEGGSPALRGQFGLFFHAGMAQCDGSSRGKYGGESPRVIRNGI